jgi:Sulfotransferase family
MLSQHPQIAIAGKFDFLVDGISQQGRFMKRDAFVKMLELNRSFGELGLAIAPGLNFTGLANDFLDQIARPKDAIIVGATLHRNFDRLLRLWPDARFIHLVRDGRDVGMSMIPIGRAGTMWYGTREWANAEELWARMSAKLPVERQISVKFEDFAGNAERELRRIAAFMGVAYMPEMLRHDAPAAYIAQLSGSMGKWRGAHPADLSAAEHRCARWLLQSGYFLSGSVRPPSILRRIILGLQDRFMVAMYRREQIGTQLWLAGLWTRIFGSEKAKIRMKHRQNEAIQRSAG